MDPRLVKISKYLSKHLRHDPGRLGLTLAAGGWVEVDVLLQACARHNFPITREDLNEVVAQNDKQRFAFDETGLRIRANQGHSVEVDLELLPIAPPALLFHGTGQKTVDIILKTGLKKMARHHVHLSADRETALKVGRRHGKPALFTIDCPAMVRAGFLFYCSQNGVWLVDAVPPEFLAQIDLSSEN
ncbi:MAG: RNA 2'-phosphotransferase [Gemmataceae bacterium]